MLRTRFHLIPMYDTPTEADTTSKPDNDNQETPKPNKLVADCGPSKHCQPAPPHSQTAERQSRPGLPGAVLLVRINYHAYTLPGPLPKR